MPERNVTEEEAAIMLRLAKEGVPAWDLDRRVAEEITARKCMEIARKQGSHFAAYGIRKEFGL